MAAVVPFVPLIAAVAGPLMSGLMGGPEMPSTPAPPALPPPPEAAKMPELPPVLQAGPTTDTNSNIVAEQERQKAMRRQASSYNEPGLLESSATSKKTLLGE